MLFTARKLAARAAATASLPANLNRATFSSEAHYPTFAFIAFLAPMLAEMGPDAAALTSDTSGATPIEASDGNWRMVMETLAPAVPPGLAPRAAAFDTHIAPSAECVSTRAKAMASWRTVITWAVHLFCPCPTSPSRPSSGTSWPWVARSQSSRASLTSTSPATGASGLYFGPQHHVPQERPEP